MLKANPLQRCHRRQAIAKEILDSSDELLESNCRKLKTLFPKELEFISKEGRFDFEASQQGSRVFAVVSLLSELLKGDTQLVESINSIIRLIGNRSPNIDLETMSARITTKKALTPAVSMNAQGSSVKRWSVVSTHARPLLMELTLAGAAAYKEVLQKDGRFAQPLRTTMPALEASLKNTDISQALPDVRRTPQKQWVSAQALKLKSSIDSARRESARLRSFAPLRTGCLTVFCIRRVPANPDDQEVNFYLQLLTYRSLLFVVRLQCQEDGSLRLPERSGTVTWHSIDGWLSALLSEATQGDI